MGSSQHWLAICPKGLEELLRDELISLGASEVKMSVASVAFSGELKTAYTVCLWSRFANRVLLPVTDYPLNDAEQLYRGAREVLWERYLSSQQTLAVDFVGKGDGINNAIFGAQRVKDAIVDRIRDVDGDRPTVDLERPDIRIVARAGKGRVTLALDLAGESLHRRGYRTVHGDAPLKENLAAAILARANWPQVAKQGGALIDPMCGSGTLLIEGAMMAADIAPGLFRGRWGFSAWKGHDAELWQSLRDEASARKKVGLENVDIEIRGYDADSKAISISAGNVMRAGLDDHIRLLCKPLHEFTKPTHKPLPFGLVVTNPPYGERLGEFEQLKGLYRQYGQILKRDFAGWQAAVFTGNGDLSREMQMRPAKVYKLFNGRIPCEVLRYDEIREAQPEAPIRPWEKAQAALQAKHQPPPLSDGAQMLLNRLKKNQRKLQNWLKNSGVSCYRLYDQDLPEYAVAIDVYDNALHVQEYAPPKTIDPKAAAQRIREVKEALAALFPDWQEKFFFKERRQQKDGFQYDKKPRAGQEPDKTGRLLVDEYGAKLAVDLATYLDTGLFLDHRPVRQMLRKMARGGRLLNLFCYTATATVQAALGGAKSSVSVDMSNRYLDWARHNFELNRLDKDRHLLIRADVTQWLKTHPQKYTLIFLDPPTFSNSKKMEEVLDIQRDHIELIDDCMALLERDGTLVFSNNFRRFKLDESVSGKYAVDNITAKTFDPDFQRDQKLHHCFLIKHKGA